MLNGADWDALLDLDVGPTRAIVKLWSFTIDAFFFLFMPQGSGKTRAPHSVHSLLITKIFFPQLYRYSEQGGRFAWVAHRASYCA